MPVSILETLQTYEEAAMVRLKFDILLTNKTIVSYTSLAPLSMS